MKVKVRVHDAEEGGYWAEVPSLPGCATQGETREELLSNLHEAVDGYLENREENIVIGVNKVSRQVLTEKEKPLVDKIPDPETLEALQNSRLRKNLISYENSEELFEDLEI